MYNQKMVAKSWVTVNLSSVAYFGVLTHYNVNHDEIGVKVAERLKSRFMGLLVVCAFWY